MEIELFDLQLCCSMGSLYPTGGASLVRSQLDLRGAI